MVSFVSFFILYDRFGGESHVGRQDDNASCAYCATQPASTILVEKWQAYQEPTSSFIALGFCRKSLAIDDSPADGNFSRV
jgi:hypothetical protein